MLKCENLSFRYNKSGKNVLNSASLELGQGEIGIVLGKNGSGKTTLFKNILGIAVPESGSISFEHENLLNMSRRERARKIAYVPQDIQFGALTVFDSILMGRVAYFGLKASHEDYEAVEKIVTDMGLSDYAGRNVDELSGGERQKIAIARAMVNNPKILLADEPTGALDSKSGQQIMELFDKLNEEGVTIVMITHDRKIASNAKRIVHIIDGVITEEGSEEAADE